MAKAKAKAKGQPGGSKNPTAVSRDPTKGEHTHPKSAAARATAEKCAILTLAKLGFRKIVDVGGNADRNVVWAPEGVSVHSLNPTLDRRDGVRQLTRSSTKKCSCTLRELTERHCGHFDPDAGLFVHSHYSVLPSDFVDFVATVGAVAVVAHKFDEEGETHGEGKYTVSNSMVRQTVGGNTYTHPDGGWLFNDSLPSWISISEKTCFDKDTWVYLVCRQRGYAEEPKAPPVETKRRPTVVLQTRRTVRQRLMRATQEFDEGVVRAVWEAVPRVGAAPKDTQLNSAAAAVRRAAKGALSTTELKRHLQYVEDIVMSLETKERTSYSALAASAAALVGGGIVAHAAAKRRFTPLLAAATLTAAVWSMNRTQPDGYQQLYTTCTQGSNAPIRAIAKVVPGITQCTPKVAATLVGPVIAGTVWFPSMCTCNFETALRERALMPVPLPAVGAFALFDRFVADFLPEGPISPVAWDDYLSRLPKRRRVPLDNALETSRADDPDFKVKAFTKFEPYHKDTAPRLIQGTSIEFQAITGPSIRALAGEVASHLLRKDTGGLRLRYSYGMSAAEVGTWLYTCVTELGGMSGMRALACGDDNLIVVRTREGVVSIEADASRFDAHVAVVANESLTGYYKKTLSEERAVNALIKMNKKHKGYAKGDWSFETHGGMQSGRQDTSLGDSLLTLYVVYCAFQTLSAEPTVVEVERAIRRAYQDCGFLVKDDAIVVHRNPYEAEFCSSVFWPTDPGQVDGGWILGPKPGRMLSRLFWARADVPRESAAAEAHLRARAVRELCSPVPLLHEAVEHVLSLTAGAVSTRAQRRRVQEERFNAWTATYHPYDAAEAIPWFCARYNLTGDEVYDAIANLKALKDPSAMLSGRPWSVIRTRDLG